MTMAREELRRRRAGVLLHPTSLPGPEDFGVLGSNARRFVNFLAEAGLSLWQTLPLGPVDDSFSPYLVRSAMAGNPRLIDPAYLTRRGLIDKRPEGDWPSRRKALADAFERFEASSRRQRVDFHRWVRDQRKWLFPFALYEALRDRFDGRAWWDWPEPFRVLDPDAVRTARIEHRTAIRETAFAQFVFFQQWRTLKDYANQRGIVVFGDLPIYVSLDSVEVWWNRRLFEVDDRGRADEVAGVPPDYFSADGQLWGNPIYDWDRMREEDFQWWVDRFAWQREQFDLVRIDHFRALEAYWAVPGGAKTAREGTWKRGPRDDFFHAIARTLPLEALVAEDLGMITDEVTALRDRFGLPGMKVLQFAFDGSNDNPFLPEHHIENAVVYTGTHDNDTTLGWYRSLDDGTRHQVRERLQIADHEIPDAIIDVAFRSPARLAVVPMQDLLHLGSETRMNRPGTSTGNWMWRFTWDQVGHGLAGDLRERLRDSGRIPV
jgi:4-alpha-glucanotransferase